MDGSSTSLIPLNSLVSYGRESKIMFKNELKDQVSAPNGPNSGWAYCLKADAWIISLGTDLTHSLTSIHTNEDMYPEKWLIKNWYRKRKFRIRVNERIIEKEFLKDIQNGACYTLGKENFAMI